MKPKDSKIWYCKSCSAEWDPEADDVQIVSRTALRCTIIFEGRAHSLTLLSWETIKRRRELERSAMAVTGPNMKKKNKPEELPLEKENGR